MHNKIEYNLYKMLEEASDAVAQTLLGMMYQNGKGVPQNDAEAVQWYRKAADQDQAGAQFNLGLI